MGFGGHVMDMITRMKQNRELRPSVKLKSRREKLYNDFNSGIIKKNDQFNFKTLTGKELDEAIIRVRNRAKKDKIKEIIFTILASLLVFTLLFILII
ncbi:MAG: hypothetical protein ABFR62_07905 [Bacteroidota bacterium]